VKTDIRWSNTAARDLEVAYEFFRSGSPRTAAILVRRVLAMVQSLADNPRLGREVLIGDTTYRVVVVPPLSVYYRLDENGIVILRLWDGRRNPADFAIRE
jgi:plasmid stabilization system protein ParE